MVFILIHDKWANANKLFDFRRGVDSDGKFPLRLENLENRSIALSRDTKLARLWIQRLFPFEKLLFERSNAEKCANKKSKPKPDAVYRFHKTIE